MTSGISIRHVVVCGVAALLGDAASAQIASALIRVGDPIPNGPATEIISAITTVMTNNVGGYAVQLDSTGSGETLSHVWGNASGGPGAVLRTEGTFSGYTQTSIGRFFGIDDVGRVAYNPTISVGSSFWLEDTPILIPFQPAPGSNKLWFGASRPQISPAGTPYCVAALCSSATSPITGKAFVRGVGGTILFQTGDTLPGMPGPLGPGLAGGVEYAFSAADTHYLTFVSCAPPNSTSRRCMIYDGAVLQIGGSPAIEAVAVPTSVGGAAWEVWDEFDLFACTESGSYLIAGRIAGLNGVVRYLLVDGVLRHRDGDVVDGLTTVNAVQTVTMNESGVIAYVWRTAWSGGVRDTLFVQDRAVLTEGDAVDLDGDGVIESSSIVADIGGTRQLALASNGDVYVWCSIDVNGTTTTSDDVDAIFKIPTAAASPVVYCTAGLTTNGCAPSISADDSPSLGAANSCSIRVAGVDGHKSGLIFYSVSGSQASPWASGSTSFLCVKPPTQRTMTQDSGGTTGLCDGSIVLDWNAFQANHPSALGNPWSVGDKVQLQGWLRDPPAPKTTNLSNAVELTYVP